jgi:hypothetical protein
MPACKGSDASNQPGGWWPRCTCAVTRIASAPIATATARAAEEKSHPECDQQQRADEVEHADGDEAKVIGDAERANDDERDGENSHDGLRADLRGRMKVEVSKRQRCSPGAGG